ncbi:hypothetical protein [Clostridium brassicae]|uniref:Uncharacterized protein n=1 Tax=Clostridium brassicae TaxID=2999072 RepID=A0ABT4D6F4_9CLOT|nr:hypothetical protein [Clostridium brassicae]MCY6957879.1 hypothetical protein [Clostridium brassicae]
MIDARAKAYDEKKYKEQMEFESNLPVIKVARITFGLSITDKYFLDCSVDNVRAKYELCGMVTEKNVKEEVDLLIDLARKEFKKDPFKSHILNYLIKGNLDIIYKELKRIKDMLIGTI